MFYQAHEQSVRAHHGDLRDTRDLEVRCWANLHRAEKERVVATNSVLSLVQDSRKKVMQTAKVTSRSVLSVRSYNNSNDILVFSPVLLILKEPL